MPFVDAARALVQRLPPSDTTRVVLEYLLRHGVGRANARPWNNIEQYLNAHGINMSQTQFQQTILKETRSGDIFIGSNDRGTGRGYFLIKDKADAVLTREFYIRRITAERANLKRSDSLIRQRWPKARRASRV